MYREVGLRKADAVEALAILEETGHVRPAFGTEMGDEGRRGRKASRAWEVNPLATVSIHASVREPGRRAQEGPGSPETAFWCALFSYARDPPCHRARGRPERAPRRFSDARYSRGCARVRPGRACRKDACAGQGAPRKAQEAWKRPSGAFREGYWPLGQGGRSERAWRSKNP